MSNSYLHYSQFEVCARELAAISDKIGDGWELKQIKIYSEPERLYLVKSTSHTILPEHTVETPEDEDPLDLGEIEEPADPGEAMKPVTASFRSRLESQKTVCIEYHIVYSESYEVPILYFNATHESGRQLTLEDIWKIVSEELTSSDTDRWSLISQQEHPLLCRPFYHIHPCHTAKVMGKALQTRDSCLSTDTDYSSEGTHFKMSDNYLLTWLSTFGPLVGLKVPIAYVTSNKVEE